MAHQTQVLVLALLHLWQVEEIRVHSEEIKHLSTLLERRQAILEKVQEQEGSVSQMPCPQHPPMWLEELQKEPFEILPNTVNARCGAGITFILSLNVFMLNTMLLSRTARTIPGTYCLVERTHQKRPPTQPFHIREGRGPRGRVCCPGDGPLHCKTGSRDPAPQQRLPLWRHQLPRHLPSPQLLFQVGIDWRCPGCIVHQARSARKSQSQRQKPHRGAFTATH